MATLSNILAREIPWTRGAWLHSQTRLKQPSMHATLPESTEAINLNSVDYLVDRR